MSTPRLFPPDMSGQLDQPDIPSAAEAECQELCQGSQHLVDGIVDAIDAFDAVNIKRGQAQLPPITNIEEMIEWMDI